MSDTLWHILWVIPVGMLIGRLVVHFAAHLLWIMPLTIGIILWNFSSSHPFDGDTYGRHFLAALFVLISLVMMLLVRYDSAPEPISGYEKIHTNDPL